MGEIIIIFCIIYISILLLIINNQQKLKQLFKKSNVEIKEVESFTVWFNRVNPPPVKINNANEIFLNLSKVQKQMYKERLNN